MKKTFNKFKSDKLKHGYIDVYLSYLEKLKNKKLKILEIGVADGKSIQAWSHYFKNSLIVGIDIKKIDLKKTNLIKKNIRILQGSQSDPHFISLLVQKYKNFDIIIDDGSHFPKDVISSFKMLFPALSQNGYYFVEDIQTSYIHFFKGNPFDLKYSKTHVNFFKQMVDRLNYQEIANPFYRKNYYDGKIKSIAFFHNILALEKGLNKKKSNLVPNNSYENKRYLEKIKRNPDKQLLYYFKYKIFYKIYTLFLFTLNFLKKTILLRF